MRPRNEADVLDCCSVASRWKSDRRVRHATYSLGSRLINERRFIHRMFEYNRRAIRPADKERSFL